MKLALGLPYINLILHLVGRRDVGDNMGHHTAIGLVLALMEYGTGQRVGDNSLGFIGVGKDCNLFDSSRRDILLKLGVAHVLGQGIVVNIQHSYKENYNYGICPVHAEAYAALLGSVIGGTHHML